MISKCFQIIFNKEKSLNLFTFPIHMKINPEAQ